MKKIESLTPAQIARFPEFVKRWLDIGLSTEPANRAEAERGVNLAYKIAGLTPPQRIVWCSSPLSQGLTYAIVFGLSDGSIKLKGLPDVRKRDQVRGQVWDQVRGQVWDQVGGQVWDQVWGQVRGQVRGQVLDQVWDQVLDQVLDQVWDQVWGQVWDQVLDQVGGQVRDQVWGQVGGQVWGQVGDQVGGQVRDQVWDQVWDQVGGQVWGQVGGQVWDQVGASLSASGYGQHEAGWLSFYNYFAEAMGLGEQTQKLTGLSLIARNAGWFLPHAKVCWISERHNILRRDERGRLHCADGPALSYPDGWSIYAVHGVRVPASIILEPGSITVAAIEKESNTEIRRVMIERFGQERFLSESGALEIHRDDYGVLFRKGAVRR